MEASKSVEDVQSQQEMEKAPIPKVADDLHKLKISDRQCVDTSVKIQTAINSCPDQILKQNCKHLGLEFRGQTQSDGNCFFHAVSDQLDPLGLPRSAANLRRLVVKFMRSNPILQGTDGLIDLTELYPDWHRYCDKMAEDGEWADNLVVLATAHFVQRDIKVVMSSPQSQGCEDNMTYLIRSGASVSRDPILLGHIWEWHYQSLQTSSMTVSDITQDKPVEEKVTESFGEIVCQVEGKDKGTATIAEDQKFQQSAGDAIQCAGVLHLSHSIAGEFPFRDQTRYGASAKDADLEIGLVTAKTARKKSPEEWNQQDINEVVTTGHALHQKYKRSGKTCMDDQSFDRSKWDIVEQISGTLCMQNELFNGLNQAFRPPGIHHKCKASNTSALLICQGHVSTIVKIDDFHTYALIDSPAPSSRGLRYPSGKAVVLIFKGLQDLCAGILQLADARGATQGTPYYLHALKFIDEYQTKMQINDRGDNLGIPNNITEMDSSQQSHNDVKKKAFLLDYSEDNKRRHFVPQNGILSGESSQPYFKDIGYTELAVLSKNADAVVVKAMDLITKKFFLLKKPKWFTESEIRLPRILGGDGCHKYLGMDYKSGKDCRLMFEFIEGPTLSELMKLKAVPKELCKRLLLQILFALNKMFKHGIVHYDIHGGNIMFRFKEMVLIDFGMAQKYDSSGPLGMESGDIQEDHIYTSSEKFPYCKSKSRLNQVNAQWAQLPDIPDSPLGSPTKGPNNNQDTPNTEIEETADAWRPNVDNRKQYIGVRFDQNRPVNGITTQGGRDGWVTEYHVSYREKKGKSLTYVNNADGQKQVFEGNKDSTSLQKQMFCHPIDACEIRIHPHKWHESIALQFELHGPADDFLKRHNIDVRAAVELILKMMPYTKRMKKEALEKVPWPESLMLASTLLEDWKYSRFWEINDKCFTATSSIDKDHTPCAVRLNIPHYGSPRKRFNGWHPKPTDSCPSITVKFYGQRSITGLVTQGCGYNFSVSYKLPISSATGSRIGPPDDDDKFKWQDVTDFNGSLKVFKGTLNKSESDAPMEWLLPKEVRALAVQITLQRLPVQWDPTAAFRFELRGVPERQPVDFLTRHLQALEKRRSVKLRKHHTN